MNEAALSKETEAALERSLGLSNHEHGHEAVRRVPRSVSLTSVLHTAAPLPDVHLPPEQQRDKQPLEVLYELLSKTKDDVPRAGAEASAAMAGVFDQVCGDIMKIAKDATDRAQALYQEASNFVTVVQESKRVMCANIEDESRRAALGGLALREVAKILRGQG